MDETTYNNLLNSTLPEYATGIPAGLASQAYKPPLGANPSGYATSVKGIPNPFSTTGGMPAGGTTGSMTPSWMANAQAFGTLGLGLASFLDQRKTAGLQRDALRQNLAVSKEHQASRKALGDSWNKAWGQ